ncbi:hypothetical protein BG015_009872 [Linnemannia schmuckeri]|uniref:Uncharacterized protein n=1 Tax=Linnemannia schmuckeri TaxID=64567 RepID=A0A9P5RVA3_9FUNG|nr:hypothetical protein BG015_009872 [Linnemannia schmuckeri]
MGNIISYSRNDIIYSAILIGVWLMVRPFFVRMSERAQARSEQSLAAEAAYNDAQRAPASSSAGGRKKLD